MWLHELQQEASRPDSSAFIISFLATENWPKVKLGKVEIGLNIIHLVSKKSYLVIIIPNAYEKLT